jgi:pimeloyl-ACP methyl ester carboxylesterase
MIDRMSVERIVRANGVDLCVQTFGEPSAPAILLIAGASSSLEGWPEEFCVQLAAASRFVIRYDHRDTGRSTSYPPGEPGYTGSDLEADALGILDALGVARAHLVGVSMGGGMAQVLAIEHPDRVASLTLIATSSGPADDLPPVVPELRAFFDNPPPEPDWSDRAAVIDYLVAGELPFLGVVGRDEAELRATAARVVDRTVNLKSALTNHWIMVGGDDDGEPLRPRLARITAPTLVIHGTRDPLFPFPHGEALAAEIPGARLLPLDGVGHEVPPRPTWPTVLTALVAHTA